MNGNYSTKVQGKYPKSGILVTEAQINMIHLADLHGPEALEHKWHYYSRSIKKQKVVSG